MYLLPMVWLHFIKKDRSQHTYGNRIYRFDVMCFKTKRSSNRKAANYILDRPKSNVGLLIIERAIAPVYIPRCPVIIVNTGSHDTRPITP